MAESIQQRGGERTVQQAFYAIYSVVLGDTTAYKQDVGGSNPSSPTTEADAVHRYGIGFFFFHVVTQKRVDERDSTHMRPALPVRIPPRSIPNVLLSEGGTR